jgi:hypothetical protein
VKTVISLKLNTVKILCDCLRVSSIPIQFIAHNWISNCNVLFGFHHLKIFGIWYHDLSECWSQQYVVRFSNAQQIDACEYCKSLSKGSVSWWHFNSLWCHPIINLASPSSREHPETKVDLTSKSIISLSIDTVEIQLLIELIMVVRKKLDSGLTFLKLTLSIFHQVRIPIQKTSIPSFISWR